MSATVRRPNGLTLAEAFGWYAPIRVGDCLIWSGVLDKKGYGQFSYLNRKVRAHRCAFMLEYGIDPGEGHVDHICYQHACVNPEHLRLVTPKQNMENRSGLGANNTSGVRGVSWNKRERKWKAQVSHNRKFHHVGTFTNLAEAEAAVTAKRLELFTHNDIDRTAQCLTVSL